MGNQRGMQFVSPSGGSPSPSLPAFTSAIAAYGVNNVNPSGYVTGSAFDGNASTASFLGVTPYAIDWADYIATADPPPYLVGNWFDQNSSLNSLASGGDPIANYATHALDFDGSTSGLATAANVTLGVKFFTLYIRFKAGSLSETSILFETGSGAVGNAGIVRLSLVAGILTASVSDQTAVVALLNTKIKTISDTNWHIATVIVDTTLAAASQVTLLVDNSATGVTAPISTNLASENLTTAKFNVGARNNAASAWFTGSMSHLICFSVAQNLTLAGQWYSWINSLAFTPSSAIVSGAGTPGVDGEYTFRGMFDSFPYYNKVGDPSDPATHSIVFDVANGAWAIWPAGIGVDAQYLGSGNPWPFPWQDTFSASLGTPPAPTVTEVS